VPLSLPPAERLGPAAWNWGSGAVVITAVAAYRTAGQGVAAALGHAGVGVGLAVAAGNWNPTALAVMAITCLIPPVAAANYLQLYLDGLRRRQQAVEVGRRTAAARAVEHQQRQSVLDQVEWIKNKVTLLLESVGGDDAAPCDAAVRQEARELSTALRRELDESRSRGWVLHASAAGAAVDVLGSPGLLDDDGRAAIAALVELLGRHTSFRQIGVTVSAADGGAPAVEVTVVASGPASVLAYRDPAVQAAVRGVDGMLWLDDEAGSLVVEAVLLRAGGYQSPSAPFGHPARPLR
jgi:hypothetical protein